MATNRRAFVGVRRIEPDIFILPHLSSPAARKFAITAGAHRGTANITCYFCKLRM